MRFVTLGPVLLYTMTITEVTVVSHFHHSLFCEDLFLKMVTTQMQVMSLISSSLLSTVVATVSICTSIDVCWHSPYVLQFLTISITPI